MGKHAVPMEKTLTKLKMTATSTLSITGPHKRTRCVCETYGRAARGSENHKQIWWGLVTKCTVYIKKSNAVLIMYLNC